MAASDSLTLRSVGTKDMTIGDKDADQQDRHALPQKDPVHRKLIEDNCSIAPSDSISCADGDTEAGSITPRATSPARSTTTTTTRRSSSTVQTSDVQSYRGFASEAEYLAALRAWADSKKFAEPDDALVGFYGQTTMEEYCSRPKLDLGIKKRLRERKERRQAARQGDRDGRATE